MRVEWFGQSSFRLDDGDVSVFIDPFGDMSAARERGRRWDYPDISEDGIDLLLVTHEHADHNGVEAIGGDPAVIRSTAGRHQSPVGEVLGVASEHDSAAGTERGPNTIFSLELGSLRVAHFGDFGQERIRPEQRAALGGDIDMLIVPAGAGPTIGADGAAALAAALSPKWVIPMHYRTERIDFLDPIDALEEKLHRVHRLDSTAFETADLPAGEDPVLVIPAVP